MLKQAFLLLLCSFYLNAYENEGYTYVFFIGSDRISVTYERGLPTVSFNGEKITCPCGNAPTSIITIDDIVQATCKQCQKPLVVEQVILNHPELDEEQEKELERRAMLHRSTKDSIHRKFE